MKTTRLEAFSDAVIAIVITFMVLELKVPEHTTFAALAALYPTFLSYLLSFFVLGVYWVNHHHLLHLGQDVSGRLMWWNMNFLFWISLIPFVTAYLGRHGVTPFSTALYSLNALLCSIAFFLLRSTIAQGQHDQPHLRELHGKLAWKNTTAIVLYATALTLASFVPWLSLAIVALPTALFFLPDRRVAKLKEEDLDLEKNGVGERVSSGKNKADK
jgi:uncharacterized membrane protein